MEREQANSAHEGKFPARIFSHPTQPRLAIRSRSHRSRKPASPVLLQSFRRRQNHAMNSRQSANYLQRASVVRLHVAVHRSGSETPTADETRPIRCSLARPRERGFGRRKVASAPASSGIRTGRHLFGGDLPKSGILDEVGLLLETGRASSTEMACVSELEAGSRAVTLYTCRSDQLSGMWPSIKDRPQPRTEVGFRRDEILAGRVGEPLELRKALSVAIE